MIRQKKSLWDRAQIAPRIAPPSEEPPKCATCNHRAELHEGWFSARPKKCCSFEVGGRNRCQCKRYTKAA